MTALLLAMSRDPAEATPRQRLVGLSLILFALFALAPLVAGGLAVLGVRVTAP